MATPFRGRGLVLGWGEESTWGTPVARAVWLPVISASGQRKIARVPRPHLVGDSGALLRRSAFTSEDRTSGSFECELMYRGIGTILKHALGAVATSGTGPYTHALTLADMGPGTTLKGLTLELLRGDATNSEIFEGVMISRLTISGQQGQPVRLKVDWVAQTAQTRAAAGTPTLPTNDEPVLHSHLGQLTFSGDTLDMIDFELVIDNKLADRQFLGSAQTQQPVIDDYREVTLRATVEYTSDSTYNDQLAVNTGDVTFTATGVGNSSLAFTVHNCEVEEAGSPVSGPGVIQQKIAWRAYGDGTDLGLALDLINDDSDVDAAA